VWVEPVIIRVHEAQCQHEVLTFASSPFGRGLR
jgi:hypothetical protein